MAEVAMLPRERLLANGAQVLSDEELLRVLLRSGTQTVPLTQTIRTLLARYPGFSGLGPTSTEALLAVPGIGLSKATVLTASLEFGRRVTQRQTLRYGTVTSTQEIGAALTKRLGGQTQEFSIGILMDVKNAVIQELEIARGGVDTAVVDPRVVFRAALLANASKVILVHNHPSGDPRPSPADTAVTERFIKAGEFIGVVFLDHIIVGATDYYSFRQHGQHLKLFK